AWAETSRPRFARFLDLQEAVDEQACAHEDGQPGQAANSATEEAQDPCDLENSGKDNAENARADQHGACRGQFRAPAAFLGVRGFLGSVVAGHVLLLAL